MGNDKNQNWFALEAKVDAAAAEAIEFALDELGALGTEINNLGVKSAETLTVVGYFNELPTAAKIEEELNDALRIYNFSPAALLETSTRSVENADWLAEWKKHWKPTETGKFVVAPLWETIENTEKIVIRIEPSMAFGTGTHETTRLCLQAIEENYLETDTFFDVGTGTGILAIAAAKMQNSEFQISNSRFQTAGVKSEIWNSESGISGCDTDADSIAIAKENAAANKVADRINFYVGSISAATPKHDFVCANLTLDVIAPILPVLIEKTGRILILSGILKEQQNSILEDLKKLGIGNPTIETLGEWISVIVKNEK